jgi:hypothetical protein
MVSYDKDFGKNSSNDSKVLPERTDVLWNNYDSWQNSFITKAKEFSKRSFSSECSKLWKKMGKDGDIAVWKLDKGFSSDLIDPKWCCVKFSTIIDLSCEALKEILLDSSIAGELNKYTRRRRDVRKLDEQTKIVHTTTNLPYPFRSNDYCTLMHCCDFHIPMNHHTNASTSKKFEWKNTLRMILPSWPSKGKWNEVELNNLQQPISFNDDVSGRSYIIISKAIEDIDVPETSDYSRAETILGVYYLVPNRRDPKKTDFYGIGHARYSNLSPSIVASTSYAGILTLLKQLKQNAQRVAASKGFFS